MYIETIDMILKSFGLYLCVAFAFFKILNCEPNSLFKKTLIVIVSLNMALIEYFIRHYTSSILISIIIIYIVYSFILSKVTRNNLGFSLLVTIICLAISYGAYIISSFIFSLFIAVIPNYSYKCPINFIFISFIEFYILYIIFKIKRFKHGLTFIKNKNKNEFLDIFMVVSCIVVAFTYFLILNYHTISYIHLFLLLLFFVTLMFIIIQKSFIIYQKQKLLEKTLKDYEQEIAESKNKFEILLKEKNNLVKANHEFYHRQQALHLKLDNLIKNNKTLFKEEYGSIIDRIDTLSKEYTTTISNTETQAILPKTNISEIDDMFIYMQNECKKNNIDFTLRLTSDIYQLINNIIPKNKFETLIGDLIRNSIIAINYSSNTNRAIMIILGIKDNTYEFSIYDTGIEFKIETLSKLGLEHATTHADTGGTGIGFITTFETLKYCNASLIITEFSDKNFNYTKSITIKFDSKNNYIIETYRADQFPKNQRVKIYPTNIKI